MQFTLIDRILALEPGKQITTVKNLTMGEEYLAEHFPTFPIMPGVLMIEAIVQSGAWLVRATESFQPLAVFLREAKNVRFGQFVLPGSQLRISCEVVASDDRFVTLKAKGEVGGKQSVSARVILEKVDLRERECLDEAGEHRMRSALFDRFRLLASKELRHEWHAIRALACSTQG